ncbi:Hypothetical protein FKW44_005616, partial [Caligus rogercresseyi]
MVLSWESAMSGVFDLLKEHEPLNFNKIIRSTEKSFYYDNLTSRVQVSQLRGKYSPQNFFTG